MSTCPIDVRDFLRFCYIGQFGEGEINEGLRKAILDGVVPRADPHYLILSPISLRSVVFLHMNILGISGSVTDPFDGTEILEEIVALTPALAKWLENPSTFPFTSKRLTQLQIPNTVQCDLTLYDRKMAEYFRRLDDDNLVMPLVVDDNTAASVCQLFAYACPDCVGCMRFRLYETILFRLNEPSDSPFSHAYDPSSEEVNLLTSLNLDRPTTLSGARLLLPSIIQIVASHSEECFAHCHVSALVHEKMRSLLPWMSPESVGLQDRSIEGLQKNERAVERAVERGAVRTESLISDPSQPRQSAVLTQAEELTQAHEKEPADLILKSPARDTVWTVHFADRAEKVLRRLARKNQGALIPVVKNINMVAQGHWTNSVKCPLVSNQKVTIYECKVLNNVRILWQVDVAYLEAPQMHSQVIKVWGIGNHQDVPHTLDYIAIAHKTYSLERLDRCIKSKLVDGVHFPVTWPHDGGDSKHVVRLAENDGHSVVESLMMHEIAVTAKFIPFSKMFMRALIAAAEAPNDCEFPFAVNQQEHQILRHTSSAIICGRSGTGKTSCCVFRLICDFQSRRIEGPLKLYQHNPPPKRGFRQIFVTASEKFCNRVKVYCNSLLKSLVPIEVDIGATERFINLMEAPISKEDNLIDFDPKDFRPDDDDNFNAGGDDESLTRALPESFGDLTDADFPLFVPYRKLIAMLRIFVGLDQNHIYDESDFSETNADYDQFVKIFPTLSESLIRDMDPALVYNEMMGVIKGTEAAGISAVGCLSREEYCNLSSRAYATFEYNRDRVYDIFEAFTAKRRFEYDEYVEKKRNEGERNGSKKSDNTLKKIETRDRVRPMDELDRVNELNRRIDELVNLKIAIENEEPSKTTGARILSGKEQHDLALIDALLVNQVYIDEVQDLTMSQILPLISICADPVHGLIFAGDTAQVIAKGSVFRFEDLSAMIYGRVKLLNNRKINSKAMEIEDKTKRFDLTKNYRSHEGILGLAAEVLDLLRKYFAYAIDFLPREKGTILGPQPVIIELESSIKTFIRGDRADDANIEFGAGQVILVRKSATREALKSELDLESALILTIEQAKGMEFNDVILYDTISDSSAEPQKWRLFQHDIPGVSSKKIKAPAFSVQKHSIMATELKVLYTAITRARCRLWIWESSKEKRESLFQIWKQKALVVGNEESSQAFVTEKSTPEDWNKQGRQLFENGLFVEALASFKSAVRAQGGSLDSKNQNILLCEAYILKGDARILQAADQVEWAKIKFLEAGQCFQLAKSKGHLTQNQFIDAAVCFKLANHFRGASEMFEQVKTPSIDAIECFQHAGRPDLAGKGLESLQMPEEAVREYLKDTKLVQDAIRVVGTIPRSQNIDGSILVTVSLLGLSVLPSTLVDIRKDAIMICRSPRLMEGLYRMEGFFSELIKIFDGKKDLASVASVYEIDMGRLEDAAKIYTHCGPGTKVLDTVLRWFWQKNTPVINFYFSAGSQSKYHSASPFHKMEALSAAINHAKENMDCASNRGLELDAVEMAIRNSTISLKYAKARSAADLFLSLKLGLAGYIKTAITDIKVKKSIAVVDAEPIIKKEIKALTEALLCCVSLTLMSKSFCSALSMQVTSKKLIPIFSESIGATVVSTASSLISRCPSLIRHEVERVFCVTRSSVSKLVFPAALLRNPDLIRLSDKTGLVTTTPALFYEVCIRSLSDYVKICDSVLKQAVNQMSFKAQCVVAALYDGTCSKTGCNLCHYTSPTIGESRWVVLIVMSTILALVPGALNEKDVGDARPLREVILDLVVTSCPTLGSPYILTDTSDKIPGPLKMYLTSFIKRRLAKDTLQTRDGIKKQPFALGRVVQDVFVLKSLDNTARLFISNCFGDAITSDGSDQDYDSRPSRDFNTLLCSIYLIAFDATLSVGFIRNALNLLRASICDWTDLGGAACGFLCTVFESLCVTVTLSTRNQFVLPRCFMNRVCQMFPDCLPLRPNAHLRTLVPEIAALFLDLCKKFSDNYSLYEDQWLRIANCYLFLTQGFVDHGELALPKWIQEDQTGYPWNLIRRIMKSDTEGIILFWRADSYITSWMEKARAISSWQVQIDGIDVLKGLMGSLKEIKAHTAIGKSIPPLSGKARKYAKESVLSKEIAESFPPEKLFEPKMSEKDGNLIEESGMPPLMSSSDSDDAIKSDLEKTNSNFPLVESCSEAEGSHLLVPKKKRKKRRKSGKMNASSRASDMNSASTNAISSTLEFSNHLQSARKLRGSSQENQTREESSDESVPHDVPGLLSSSDTESSVSNLGINTASRPADAKKKKKSQEKGDKDWESIDGEIDGAEDFDMTYDHKVDGVLEKTVARSMYRLKIKCIDSLAETSYTLPSRVGSSTQVQEKMQKWGSSDPESAILKIQMWWKSLHSKLTSEDYIRVHAAIVMQHWPKSRRNYASLYRQQGLPAYIDLLRTHNLLEDGPASRGALEDIRNADEGRCLKFAAAIETLEAVKAALVTLAVWNFRHLSDSISDLENCIQEAGGAKRKALKMLHQFSEF